MVMCLWSSWQPAQANGGSTVAPRWSKCPVTVQHSYQGPTEIFFEENSLYQDQMSLLIPSPRGRVRWNRGLGHRVFHPISGNSERPKGILQSTGGARPAWGEGCLVAQLCCWVPEGGGQVGAQDAGQGTRLGRAIRAHSPPWLRRLVEDPPLLQQAQPYSVPTLSGHCQGTGLGLEVLRHSITSGVWLRPLGTLE